MRERRPIPPLDQATLERMALRYVERFATTRGRLIAYLTRKLRERGWDDAAAPDPDSVVERFAERGYIDDRGYAEAKASSMARRGLGARRVEGALRHDGVSDEDRQAIAADIAARAEAAAIEYARRKRFGRFGPGGLDRAARTKQVASMIRAGHGFDLTRRIVEAVRDDDGEDFG